MALGASLVAAVPFLLVLWDLGANPLRTAQPTGLFSNFYDLQARALLDGRLDVPTGSLSLEAFRVDGREYMYFPPFPAILRLPVVVVTDALDGQLTAMSMLLAWIVLMAFAALLAWRIRSTLAPQRRFGRCEAIGTFVVMVAIGGGSVVVQLAGLPWVYHEAFAWTVALSVGTAWAVIGVIERLSAMRIGAVFVLALAAALTRPTVGWVWCATITALGVLYLVQPVRRRRALAALLCCAGLVPAAVAAWINLAKFGQPFEVPYEIQLFSEFGPRRQAVLEANGSLMGLGYVPTTAWTYLRPDGIRFSSIFPFISLPAEPPAIVGEYTFDDRHRTGSITAFMPMLCALSLVALVACFRPCAGLARRLRVPCVAALGATIGVLAFGYIGNRYLLEFLPGLVLMSIVGLQVVVGLVESRSRLLQGGVLALLGFLALFGVAANFAVGLETARTAGGRALTGFVETRLAVSDLTGGSHDGFVQQVEALPVDAEADQIRVVGDCDAAYLATGDFYRPWAPIDVRGATVTAAVTAPGPQPGEPAHKVTLALLGGIRGHLLSLERTAEDGVRLVLESSLGTRRGPWSTDAFVSVRLDPDLDSGLWRVSSSSLEWTAQMDAWDGSLVGRPVGLELGPREPFPGMPVTIAKDDASDLCVDLLAAAARRAAAAS